MNALPAPAPLHVLIVDDHAIVREGVAELLARLRPGCISSHAADATEARAALARRPDVSLVLLDVHLPGAAPLQLLRELRRDHPLLPVAMLSGDTDPALAQQALHCGAAGYLPKASNMALFGAALQVVLDGGRHVPGFLAQHQRQAAPEALTPRQREVLDLLAHGLSNKEIARGLGLAEPTVKTHLVTVFRVLGAKNRTQAVVAAQALRHVAGQT